jgi:transposase
MMGKQNAPEELFYKFRLEDHVPADHLLRALDAVLDFDRVRTVLVDRYSHTGRPSVDPELMLRMLLVGYAYGIRSERQLCSEVHLNLAYRWFCRLGLEGAVPDRSTFSKNRYGRFRESDIYRVLFENVVNQCRKAGLVPGEGFAVEAASFMATPAVIFASKALRRSGRKRTRPQGRCGNISPRSMPVTRCMKAEPNICHRPIPPPHGTPRKGAAGSGTSPTI